MSLRDFYNNLKAKLFGRVAEDIAPPEIRAKLKREREMDIGPAKRWYIKKLFPRGVFTKKLTHAREMQVRDVFRTLRPEQKVIALRHGYNRGLKV